MKKFIKILSMAGCFWFVFGAVVSAAPQCTSNINNNDAACWTSTGSGYYQNCTVYSAGHGSYFVCKDGNQTTDPNQFPNCRPYLSALYDTCGGYWGCANRADVHAGSVISNWISTISYTCHYIGSFEYGACKNHNQLANKPNWTSTPGTTCTNAVMTNLCNTIPEKPTLTGPVTGNVNVDYSFTATGTDSDGDDIRYDFDWDNNGTVDQNTGSVPSGTPQALPRQWPAIGNKTLKVRVCDGYGGCSVWSNPHTINITQAPIPGACGVRAKAYLATQTQAEWLADMPCSMAGMTPTPASVSFPAPGQTTPNWTCSGLYGGGQGGNCSATRGYYTCSGSIVPNSSPCTNDSKELMEALIPSSVALIADCAGQYNNIKCEYGCNFGYIKVGNACNCVPTDCAKDTCIGKKCSDCVGGIRGPVDGLKDCRDQNWQEVSPE